MYVCMLAESDIYLYLTSTVKLDHMNYTEFHMCPSATRCYFLTFISNTNVVVMQT